MKCHLCGQVLVNDPRVIQGGFQIAGPRSEGHGGGHKANVETIPNAIEDKLLLRIGVIVELPGKFGEAQGGRGPGGKRRPLVGILYWQSGRHPCCGTIWPRAGTANDVELFSPSPRAAIDPAKSGGADGAETTTDVPGGVWWKR